MEIELAQVAPGQSLELRDRADARVVPLAQRHTGSGVPQYRSRERAQSTLPSSHLPKRPCLMCSGCHPMPSFSRRRSSRRSDVRTNQDVLAQ